MTNGGTVLGSTIGHTVEIVAVSKNFGGAQALSDVDLTITQGTVHALVGENGAGKSTLGKIIAGIIPPDHGEVLLDGEPVSFRNPREALAMGIASITQEGALVPGLTVEQNVFLGGEPSSVGFIQRRGLRKRFVELSREVEFDLRPDAVVGTLRKADQQKVEILRAIASNASFIVLDEPSATLAAEDIHLLHRTIRSLARNGRTILLISHFLAEVLQLSDSVTVLRDGRLIRTSAAADETESSLIQAMLGRSMESIFPDKVISDGGSTVLELEHFSAPGVKDVSLSVRAGEILGIAGLVGAGRTELVTAIYGGTRSRGTLRLHGDALSLRSPATARRHGLFMIPESRKESGLIPKRSVIENTTVSSLKELSTWGFIRPVRERRTARNGLKQSGVVARPDDMSVHQLSGGNQQKVLFARALLCAPSLLIADEPTRGVDVGSRRAIYEIIRERALAGLAVIVISSDVEEIIGLAHRVVVMAAGRIVRELDGPEITEANILDAAFTRVTDHDTDAEQPGVRT